MGNRAYNPMTHCLFTFTPAFSLPELFELTISKSGKSLAPLPESVLRGVWCGFWMGTLKSKV